MAALALKQDKLVRAVEPFPELDAEACSTFSAKSPLPFVEANPNRVPLLVTRLPLPETGWTDTRGKRFRVVRQDGLAKLYPEFPVNFKKNDWK